MVLELTSMGTSTGRVHNEFRLHFLVGIVNKVMAKPEWGWMERSVVGRGERLSKSPGP